MGTGTPTGKKFGRNKARSKAMQRYNGARRDLVNKARKVARHEKAVKAAAEKKVKRGLARAKRRGNLCKLFEKG